MAMDVLNESRVQTKRLTDAKIKLFFIPILLFLHFLCFFQTKATYLVVYCARKAACTSDNSPNEQDSLDN